MSEKSDEMKKNIRCIIVMVCMFLTLCLSAGTTSYAYTEEEKAQAKAWLSAHGYSPDAGGASQAYQDYLNGKFDEELGITRTEQTSSETSEAVTETTTEIESSTEKTRRVRVLMAGKQIVRIQRRSRYRKRKQPKPLKLRLWQRMKEYRKIRKRK